MLCLTGDEAAELTERRVNEHFLPGVELPARSSSWPWTTPTSTGRELVVYAVPTQVVRQVARWVGAAGDGAARLQLSLAKGLELGTLKRPSEIIEEETGSRGRRALGPQPRRGGGPRHAVGDRDRLPRRGASRTLLQQAITCDTFRVYTNTDVLGVEFCGAAKNPIALAVGMSDGLGYGDNTRASLMTRSIAEMARLGTRLGARIETFAGLAGIGDLIATCTSRHSRNRLAGELLAKGESPAQRGGDGGPGRGGHPHRLRAARPGRPAAASTCRSPRTSTRCSSTAGRRPSRCAT